MYATARARLTADSTYVMVLGDEVVLQHEGQRTTRTYTPPLYHALKGIAHLPLAVFVVLYDPVASEQKGDYPLQDDARNQASQLLEGLEGIKLAALPFAVGAQQTRQTLIVDHCRRALRAALASGRTSYDALSTFGSEVTTLLALNAKEAAQAQIAGLHRAVTDWESQLTPTEASSYRVVVSGAHQARDENLQVTYFRRRFGEAGPTERRIIFAESVFDEPGARALLGTHLLDRAASVVFFNDESRLQRDLLGEEAARIAEQLQTSQ
jgi:hypothetical protein